MTAQSASKVKGIATQLWRWLLLPSYPVCNGDTNGDKPTFAEYRSQALCAVQDPTEGER